MIKIASLAHIYPKGQRINFPDWEIETAEQWLLLGASGSGKSTLLNHMAGLLRPTEGSVEINGTDLYSLSARKLDGFRGKNIGIVFQRPHLVRSLRVIENLDLAASMAGNQIDRNRNMQLLDNMGLSGKEMAYPDELSQGQMQRVSVARALVNKPDLLIADEPTSSLDDISTQKVIELLTSQAKDNGATLIIATHDTRVKNLMNKTYQI